MRKIKFRGLFTDENDYRYWVFGQLVNDNDTYWIVGDVIEANEEYINVEYWYPVDAKTVGQYTGLKDKNDVEIYEGDIIKFDDIDEEKDIGETNSISGYDFENYGEVVIDSIDGTKLGKIRNHEGASNDWREFIDCLDLELFWSEIEVIGNIYENKDLIENET